MAAAPFAYRDAKWNYHALAQWEDAADDERCIEWARDFDAAMAEFAEAGVYVNFAADPSATAVLAGFGSES